MALRRQVWNDAGPLSGEYHFYCQDLDLCWRAQKKGWKIGIMSDVQVIHHLGGTIRSGRNAVGKVHATHLWRDLVQFFFIHRGTRAGYRAARSIQIGAWFRVLFRRIATPFIAQPERMQWREDTKAYARAHREISRQASALPDPQGR